MGGQAVKQQLYRYVGPGAGQGEIHACVLHDEEADEVVTISGRHSWLGTVEEFQRCFHYA
jgi:hypothetical protein